MTALRPPVIAGITRGTGTSTVALALHGVDGGVWAGPEGGADVLVADRSAMRRLGSLGPRPAGPRPVLAIVDVAGGSTWPGGAQPGPDEAALTREAVLAALGPAAPCFARVVPVPPVPAVRTGAFPAPALAGLLACDAAHLDGPERLLAAALREIADALVAEGRLTTGRATTPHFVPAPPRRDPARGAAPPASAPRPIAHPTRVTGPAMIPAQIAALVARPTTATWGARPEPITSRAPVFSGAAPAEGAAAPQWPAVIASVAGVRALPTPAPGAAITTPTGPESTATSVPGARRALWPGLGPVERPRPAGGPVEDPDLDDDAVEAAHTWRVAG